MGYPYEPDLPKPNSAIPADQQPPPAPYSPGVTWRKMLFDVAMLVVAIVATSVISTITSDPAFAKLFEGSPETLLVLAVLKALATGLADYQKHKASR